MSSAVGYYSGMLAVTPHVPYTVIGSVPKAKIADMSDIARARCYLAHGRHNFITRSQSLPVHQG